MSDEIQKNILTEIHARHEQDQRWRNGPSMICPHAHDDRGWLLSEIERLRARVEALERVREAAEAWRADFALPVDHLRTARACLHLVAALDEVKA
jgi:hypothetical protein